jgi:hypothetical protein
MSPLICHLSRIAPAAPVVEGLFALLFFPCVFFLDELLEAVVGFGERVTTLTDDNKK